MIKKAALFVTIIFSFFLVFTPTFAAPESALAGRQPRVLVIGAGIAGLAAANALVKNQVPVLVLEGRNRVGGRIYTSYAWGPGFDLGASWIHGFIHNPIAELATDKKLDLIPTYYNDQASLEKFKSIIFHDPQGKELSQTESQSLVKLGLEFDRVIEKHGEALADTSLEAELKAFMQRKQLDQHTQDLFYYIAMLVYTHEHAADLDSLSVHFTHIADHSEVKGKNVVFSNGYSQILPDLVEQVPIALNQRVKKISYGAKGVEVYTDSRHFHADYVIVTVPLGVLKAGNIQFSPALPLNKQNSIHKMRMGVYDKIYLLFDKPFWEKDKEWIGYAPANPRDTIEIMNYYKINKTPVLLLFTAGSLAERMEKWSDPKIVAYMMNLLQKMYGKKVPKPTSYAITRWNQDPFAHGSYSYLPEGENFRHYEIMAAPIAKRLFFAGEATSRNNPATVHGAYATGLRAAREVMDVMTEASTLRLQQQLALTGNEKQRP